MPSPDRTSSKVITLTTDFGTVDPFVAEVKAVIVTICPEARIIDVTHEVQPYCTQQAGFLVATTYGHFPAGSIHVIGVDPEPGEPALVLQLGEHVLIGTAEVLGCVLEHSPPETRDSAVARELDRPEFWRTGGPSPFRARDVFAPVAAHLTRHTTFSDVGRVTGLPGGRHEGLRIVGDHQDGIVLHIDRFGNIITSIHSVLVGDGMFEVNVGDQTLRGSLQRLYVPDGGSGQSGSALDAHGRELSGCRLMAGSSGYLEIIWHRDHAARRLAIQVGDAVSCRRLPPA